MRNDSVWGVPWGTWFQWLWVWYECLFLGGAFTHRWTTGEMFPCRSWSSTLTAYHQESSNVRMVSSNHLFEKNNQTFASAKARTGVFTQTLSGLPVSITPQDFPMQWFPGLLFLRLFIIIHPCIYTDLYSYISRILFPTHLYSSPLWFSIFLI